VRQKPGQYRDRIHIYNETSADGSDDPAFTTTRWRNLPCSITAVTGGETYRGRQIEATVTHVIEMRYYAGILPNMRAYQPLTTTYYEIRNCLSMDNNARIMMQVTEVVL
jgi:head-tail adaptor